MRRARSLSAAMLAISAWAASAPAEEPPSAAAPAPADAEDRHPLLALRRDALRATHLSMIHLMRGVSAAQGRAMASGAVDADRDGVGEAWTLAELMGDPADKSASVESGRPLLPSVLRDPDAEGTYAAQGYLIRLYLPGADGAALACPSGARPDGVSPDFAERAWCLFAWPERYGITGRFTFALTADAALAIDEPAYGGRAAPAPGDAFEGGRLGATAPGRAAPSGRAWLDATRITPQQIDVPDPPRSATWRDAGPLRAALADAAGAVASAAGFASAEAAFGAKLPDVRAGTRDDVRAVLAAELAPFFDRTQMDARSRAAALQWMTLGLFAKYDVAADTVIVVPATIEATAELFGLPWLREPSAAKALLCHEAVHALDARRTKLFDRARAAADGPEMQAVSAVIEGHAQHLGALAAAKLGIEKEFARVTDASSGDALAGRASESPAIRASAAASRFPYVEGARFVAKIAAERGADGVAALLADPPPDPLWIERPSLWTAREATERTRARVAAALRAFDGAMPADLARGGESPSIGALREQLRASGLAADDPCLDRIADTAARTWSERQGFVVAGVLAFDDEESAAAFVALERRLSEARDRAPGAVAATYADGAAGLPGHRARRVPENAPATEVWTVRAGRFVLETSFSGPRFKAAAVEEALRGASAALAAPDGEKTDAPK